MEKRVLIIANGAMSDTDSNGRTIARLFDCFSKEQKAQFFTYGEPDFSQCDRYYKVSDNDALHSLLRLRPKDGKVHPQEKRTEVVSNEKPSVKKTPLALLLRETVWKISPWKNRYLKQWIDEVDPNCIFLYLGDNWFTVDLAIWISRKKQIPILVYSTEEYTFKDYNYITKRKSLFYSIWLKKLRKSYSRLSKYTKLGLFNSRELTKLYASTYPYPCRTLYQSSDIEYCSNYRAKDTQRISYLGNLRLNRHKALIEIAQALQSLNQGLVLDIYGNADERVRAEFEKQPNIRLHGFVPYAKVTEVIHRSTLLIHAEYSDVFYNRDLKYAFSTKITDSVCSGTPLFLYTPRELVCADFVLDEGCAFYEGKKEKLAEVLYEALFDEEARKNVAQNAERVKEQHFTNRGALKEIIEGILDEGTTG